MPQSVSETESSPIDVKINAILDRWDLAQALQDPKQLSASARELQKLIGDERAAAMRTFKDLGQVLLDLGASKDVARRANKLASKQDAMAQRGRFSAPMDTPREVKVEAFLQRKSLTLSTEDEILAADPEDFVILIRGLSERRYQAIEDNGSAAGTTVDPDAPPPSEDDIRAQVGGFRSGLGTASNSQQAAGLRSYRCPEFGTSPQIAAAQSTGGAPSAAVRTDRDAKGKCGTTLSLHLPNQAQSIDLALDIQDFASGDTLEDILNKGTQTALVVAVKTRTEDGTYFRPMLATSFHTWAEHTDSDPFNNIATQTVHYIAVSKHADGLNALYLGDDSDVAPDATTRAGIIIESLMDLSRAPESSPQTYRAALLLSLLAPELGFTPEPANDQGLVDTLCLAAAHGLVEELKNLDCSADALGQTDATGTTPLEHAIANRQLGAAMVLLQRGAIKDRATFRRALSKAESLPQRSKALENLLHQHATNLPDR